MHDRADVKVDAVERWICAGKRGSIRVDFPGRERVTTATERKVQRDEMLLLSYSS